PPTLNLRAMVRPMPELAPVGIATLPLSIVMRHLPSVGSRVEEGGRAEAKCGNPDVQVPRRGGRGAVGASGRAILGQARSRRLVDPQGRGRAGRGPGKLRQ